MSGDTWDICRSLSLFRLRGCHPLQLAFPCHSPRNEVCNFLDSCGESSRSHNTGAATAATLTLCRFGLIPVRSPLLGKSSFLSFPAGTEMFQFPAFASHTYVFSMGSWSLIQGVSAFRRSPDLRLVGGSPELIAAVLRPSSPSGARTSTMNSS